LLNTKNCYQGITMVNNMRYGLVHSGNLARSLVVFSILLAFSPFSFSQNLLTNPGFENNTNGWTLERDASAQYTESGGRSGSRLTHWSSRSAYQAETRQTVTGLSAGTYRLSAYTIGGNTAGAWLWAYCNGQSFSTPIPPSAWNSWTQVSVDNIQVTGTSCVVGITTENSDWTSIDDVVFEPVSASPGGNTDNPGGNSEILIEENATGFCSVDGTVDSNHDGFTGSGFANTANVKGNGVEWQVDVSQAGTYGLQWRYANGGGSDRPGDVYIDDQLQFQGVPFPETGSWSNWADSPTIELWLDQGSHTVRLQSVTSDGLGNLDSLTIVGSGIKPRSCSSSPPVTDSCGDMNGNGSLSSCSGDPAECKLGGGVGSYRVAMRFDAGYSGDLEVFAESRRRMFTSPQQSTSTNRCVEFLVDVRDPEGQPYQSDHGTPGLNLRITKGARALTGLSAIPVSRPKTLFIAGDSTVCDQQPQLYAPAKSRYTGWGQFIPTYFGNGISVSNYADSGESTAAFRTDGGGLWRKIDARLKSGDWVMIQLGHNDKKTSASTYRSRITNMVNAIRSKGANPILISPMIRNTGRPLSAQHIWGDLNIRNELIGVARAKNVPFIDLMKLSSEWANRIGRSAAQAYFVDSDKTHSNEMGAELFAQMIVSEIRQRHIGIAKYLRTP
jgi:lysophospholipase L1-like esterase